MCQSNQETNSAGVPIIQDIPDDWFGAAEDEESRLPEIIVVVSKRNGWVLEYNERGAERTLKVEAVSTPRVGITFYCSVGNPLTRERKKKSGLSLVGVFRETGLSQELRAALIMLFTTPDQKEADIQKLFPGCEVETRA